MAEINPEGQAVLGSYLYITTDAFEAEALIEDTSLGEEPKHKYQDIGFKEGENLEKRIGFNPMCSVELNGSISAKDLDAIARRLIKEGLYAATEADGKIKNYIPADAKEREEMVKLAFQKTDWPTQFLLQYSNNPNKIKDYRLSCMLSLLPAIGIRRF